MPIWITDYVDVVVDTDIMASGDALGAKNSFSGVPERGMIHSVTVRDAAKQSVNLDVVMFDTDITGTATKIVRLVLEKATIVLNPIEYGQTSLTLSAEISLGQVSEVDGDVSPTKSMSMRSSMRSSMGSSTKTGLTSNFKSSSAAEALGLGLGVTAEKLLYKLVELLYNNFEKEHVIDSRQMQVRRR